MAKPGALRALRQAEGREPFDADQRAKAREDTPVVIGGVSFTRRRKAWDVSRRMRQAMRDQETSVALSTRLRARSAELEVEQIEAATKGETDRETELEAQITALIEKADDATGDAELVSYRLLALLLVPPAELPAEIAEALDAETLHGWGPSEEEIERVDEAIEFLQPHLDVEDVADLARELTGSQEPDPPTTPSSGTGSD